MAQVKKDSEMNAVTNIEALALQTNEVDELGALLAQIAELTARADAIKDAMKDEATLPGGAKVFEGALFKATHSESNVTLFDSKKFIKECGQAMYDKYTKTSARFSIRVTSR